MCSQYNTRMGELVVNSLFFLSAGAQMEALAAQLLGVKESGFSPTHTRNLANEFKCYVNYDSSFQ